MSADDFVAYPFCADEAICVRLLQIHNLCEAGMNYCHKVIKEQDNLMTALAQAPLVPNPSWPVMNTDYDTPESPYPAASSCAKCHDEKTAKKGYKMSRCSACKLIRYCW